MVGTWYEPQISTWRRSKAQGERLLLCGKGSLFYLAKGQTVHTSVLLWDWEKLGNTLERKDILEKEWWPSLQCQTWRSLFLCFTELRLYKRLCKLKSELVIVATWFEVEEMSKR